MVDRSLVDRKLDASIQLTHALLAGGSPLLAAFWEWREENGNWVLILVPESPQSERGLIDAASALLIQSPYRPVFSIFDLVVDARQIRRAHVLGEYFRRSNSIGRQIDTLFTGGEFFESVVPVYLAPQLSSAPVAS